MKRLPSTHSPRWIQSFPSLLMLCFLKWVLADFLLLFVLVGQLFKFRSVLTTLTAPSRFKALFNFKFPKKLGVLFSRGMKAPHARCILLRTSFHLGSGRLLVFVSIFFVHLPMKVLGQCAANNRRTYYRVYILSQPIFARTIFKHENTFSNMQCFVLGPQMRNVCPKR